MAESGLMSFTLELKLIIVAYISTYTTQLFHHNVVLHPSQKEPLGFEMVKKWPNLAS